MTTPAPKSPLGQKYLNLIEWDEGDEETFPSCEARSDRRYQVRGSSMWAKQPEELGSRTCAALSPLIIMVISNRLVHESI